MQIKNLEKLVDGLRIRDFLNWADNLKKNNAGVEVYLVGGAVRDALLGVEEIKDYDFVLRGISLEKLGKELEKLGKVNLVGKNFGVFKFIPQNVNLRTPYDIALPRTEIAFGTGGYRDFKVNYNEKLPLKDDLSRRDFTINALAYNIFDKKLIDEFNGIKDLERKIIRTVGNAFERFEEDYSRMLRAIRFSCQLGFQIEEITWEAIKKLMVRINNKQNFIDKQAVADRKKKFGEQEERVVPYEVIATEFLKTFVLNPVHAFDLYDKSGAFKELVPEILKMRDCPQPDNWHSEGDVLEHTRLCLKGLQGKGFKERFKNKIILCDSLKPKNQKSNMKKNDDFCMSNEDALINPELVMAVLFHDLGKPYTIKTPEKDGTDRIRFNNHDMWSAKKAKEIFERLKLSAAPEFDFDINKTAWLISKHHLFDTKPLNEMKNSTVEKYFFGDNRNGENLLKLGFIDMSSTILRETGQPDLTNFNLMVERINILKKLGKGERLPERLIDGELVMGVLKIKPGKMVGLILDKIRERQLAGKIKTKEEAVGEIKKISMGKKYKNNANITSVGSRGKRNKKWKNKSDFRV